MGGHFTQMLAHFRRGDSDVEKRLIEMVYDDLRRLASRQLHSHRSFLTLHTTALINESYLRLVSPAAQHVQTKDHFMYLASRVMRQIVCDHARKRVRTNERFEARDVETVEEAKDEDRVFAERIAALDEALSDLAKVDERKARVVECKFFAGMTDQETADALGLSTRTVHRDWEEARRWLEQVLQPD